MTAPSFEGQAEEQKGIGVKALAENQCAYWGAAADHAE